MIGTALALELLRMGRSVIPLGVDHKRPTIQSWAEYSTRRMTETEVRQFFRDNSQVGLVCGEISGTLEVIDFDTLGLGSAPHYKQWIELLREYGYDKLIDLLAVAQTPSGGYHVYLECPAGVQGNTKIAETEVHVHGEPDCLIESRGEGGYVVAVGCPGYKWIQHGMSSIPVITKEDRAMLWDCARSLNKRIEAPKIPYEPKEKQRYDVNGKRPGDVYNENVYPEEILNKIGWELGRIRGDRMEVVRPGKKDGGISGTVTQSVPRVFYPFSSNAYPFEPFHSYTAFHMFTILEYGGDFSSAARAAAEKFNLPKASPPKPEAVIPVSGNPGFNPQPLDTFDPNETMKYGICGKYVPLQELTLIEGTAGEGKTTLVIAIASGGSVGKCLLTQEDVEPFKTLILTTEGRGGAYHKRAKEFRGDPSMISIEQSDTILDKKGIDTVFGCMVDRGFKLLVLDPVWDYKPGDVNILDENQTAAWAKTIQRRAEKHNVAVILVNHFAKFMAGKQMHELGRHNGGLYRKARSGICVFTDPENKRLKAMRHSKPNFEGGWLVNLGMEWNRCGLMEFYRPGEVEDGFIDDFMKGKRK